MSGKFEDLVQILHLDEIIHSIMHVKGPRPVPAYEMQH